MYRILIAICVVFAMTQASFAQSQVKRGTLSFNSGFSLPSAPVGFADYWKTGFNFGAGLEYPLSPKVIFQGCFDYNNFPLNEDKFLSEDGPRGLDVSVEGGAASITTVSANLKAPLSVSGSSVTPYFVGGLGIIRISLSDVTVRYQDEIEIFDGVSETAVGLIFGAGLDFTINPKVNMFVEIKYVIGVTQDESTRYYPVKIGLSFK